MLEFSPLLRALHVITACLSVPQRPMSLPCLPLQTMPFSLQVPTSHFTLIVQVMQRNKAKFVWKWWPPYSVEGMKLLFQSWKRGHMVHVLCVCVWWFIFLLFFPPALLACLTNYHASLFKPCFCFLGGLHMKGAQLEASSGWRTSELGEGKPAMDQKPFPPTDGGLCRKSQAAVWWQVCVFSVPVSCS